MLVLFARSLDFIEIPWQMVLSSERAQCAQKALYSFSKLSLESCLVELLPGGKGGRCSIAAGSRRS